MRYLGRPMCLAGLLLLPMLLLAAAVQALAGRWLGVPGIGFFGVGARGAPRGPRCWAAQASALAALYAVPALFVAISAAGDRPIAPQIGEVAKGMPAEAAGLRAGDRILAVNGVPVKRFTELPDHLVKGKPNAITLERGVIDVPLDEKGLLGVLPDRSARLDVSAGDVVWAGVSGPVRIWGATFRAMGKLFRPEQPLQLYGAGESGDWWVRLMAIHFSYAWPLAWIAVFVNALLVALRSSGTRTAAG